MNDEAYSAPTEDLEACRHTYWRNAEHHPLSPGSRAHPTTAETLYVVGDRTLLQRPAVAMTGTRSPSQYGTTVATAVGQAAAALRTPLITGGAVGCDAFATKAALDAGGQVILALSSGADMSMDDYQAGMVRAVLKSGGCIVSYQPFGTAYTAGSDADRKRRLLQRNQLIVDLAGAIVAVAGTQRSGTSAATWKALATGVPVAVAAPGLARLPDQELPAFLAMEHPNREKALKTVGATEAAINKTTGRGTVASGVIGEPSHMTPALALMMM